MLAVNFGPSSDESSVSYHQKEFPITNRVNNGELLLNLLIKILGVNKEC